MPVNSQEEDYKALLTLNQQICLSVLLSALSLFDTESLLFISGANFISLLRALCFLP